jgi:CheY-like chemotaxis protein
MGLGLALVERACALRDHRLGLRSEPGRGTSFSVGLTVMPGHARRVPSEAATTIPVEPGDGGDRIALLVENDADLRRAIALLLERRGVCVLEAESGEEALELLDEIDIVPDLYIVDHQLAGALTGVETIGALRARHGDRPTRLITANRAGGVRAAAAGAGVEILYKPIDSAALEAFVHEAG